MDKIWPHHLWWFWWYLHHPMLDTWPRTSHFFSALCCKVRNGVEDEISGRERRQSQLKKKERRENFYWSKDGQWEKEKCHLLNGEYKRNKGGRSQFLKKKKRRNRRARRENGRKKSRREKTSFFSLKGGKQKFSSNHFFSFSTKKSKNQTKSKYDLLF